MKPNVAKLLTSMAEQTRRDHGLTGAEKLADLDARKAVHFGRAQGFEMAAALVAAMAQPDDGDDK